MRILIPFLALCASVSAQHPTTTFTTPKGDIKLTAIRHATFMLQAGGQVLYADPWSQANLTGLPKADIILITDTHGDHLDAKALELLTQPSTIVVAPPEAAAKIPGARVLKNGESTSIGPWKFDAVAMYNLKRGPAEGRVFHDKGRGNGYVINWGGFRLYASGDTEGVDEMRALKNIDAALICMNLPYTMPPDEAADAVRAFKPKVAIPYHYRGADLSVFDKALAGSGVEVRLMDWYK